MGKPLQWYIDLNGGSGELKSHAESPSSNEEDVFIQSLDSQTHGLRFVPKENGVYYVHMRLNDAHIPVRKDQWIRF